MRFKKKLQEKRLMRRAQYPARLESAERGFVAATDRNANANRKALFFEQSKVTQLIEMRLHSCELTRAWL
jgi:hypothetical protein